MKQRVVVQAIIQEGGKTLLLKRSQGRPGIVGKFELPGGTLDDKEQPEDGLRRHLKNDAGLVADQLVLRDAMTLTNREEGDVQHVFIVFSAQGITEETQLTLGSSYDAYAWKTMQELQQNDLRDSAYYLLGLNDASQEPAGPSYVVINNDDKKSTNNNRVTIYSDGGSRGNPGPSAAAFVMLDDRHHVIGQGGTYLGITSNNQSEYHGVRLGLEKAVEMGIESVELRIDSMLVVNQLKGAYKIKNRELWPINERITELIPHFHSVRFVHVPRELNQMADSLVNKFLDEHKTETV